MSIDELTFKDVEDAVKLLGIKHSVLSLLENLEPQFLEYINNKPSLNCNSNEHQNYLKKNLGFFSKKIEKIEDYNLKPIELLAIYSKISNIGLRNYDFSNMFVTIGIKFASEGLKNPLWRNASSTVFESDVLPKGLKEDGEILQFKSRVDELGKMVYSIGAYFSSHPTKHEKLFFSFLESAHNGMGSLRSCYY